MSQPVFVDASAWVALADTRESRHADAVSFALMRERGITHAFAFGKRSPASSRYNNE
ncbi:hypothetical protein HYR99_40140 [Candidatus Poribacteria bacterium]|nr:hypothetical protein [Candidatus Poribacteria bacterium]